MQQNYGINLHNYIDKIISDKIQALEFGFPCEIIEYNGIQAEVKILLKGYENIKLKDICILQSPYLHLPFKKGDKGILLNVGYIFNELLNELPISNNIKSLSGSALLFLPFISETLKAQDIETTTLYNETRDSTLILKGKNLTYKSEDSEFSVNDKNLKFDNQDLTFEIKDGIVSIDNKSLKLKIKDNEIIIEGGVLKFDNSKIKIEGLAGSLNKAFDNVFNAIDLLSTGLIGAGSNPSAYNAGKQAFKQAISQIVD